ncbi:MAG TPA: 2Fe-2S iron-sulfur cluster-binding protein [Anaerolineae bacterium]|nr:2Fe-2S iron-sulfur cluster-binding protein [Anaerolineae bacterium]
MTEIIHWLQDIYHYRRVARRRKELRRPGQGVDYTADRDTVRRVVSRLHPKRMRLRVAEVVDETPTTKTLRLERVDGPLPPWRPGQYVNVFVDVDGVLTSRPYSISSVPGKNTLDLTVRDKPGGFVAPYLLNQVQVGDELETTGPAGTFYHEALIDGSDLVFLAGGSGVTPFMGIIREALENGRALDMHLLYGSRTPDDVLFGEELAALARNHANLHYTLVVSEPPPGYDGVTGFLTADVIRAHVGDVTGKTFYICGPGVMYDFCLAALADLGVPAYKIKRELYGPPVDVTHEPGWPEGVAAGTLFQVEVVGRETIQAPAGEPLLNSLERYGIVVPAVCRAGECSACRTRLLSGRVFQPAHTGLRESDREHGYIHACVSYPVEDIRIRLL